MDYPVLPCVRSAPDGNIKMHRSRTQKKVLKPRGFRTFWLRRQGSDLRSPGYGRPSGWPSAAARVFSGLLPRRIRENQKTQSMASAHLVPVPGPRLLGGRHRQKSLSRGIQAPGSFALCRCVQLPDVINGIPLKLCAPAARERAFRARTKSPACGISGNRSWYRSNPAWSWRPAPRHSFRFLTAVRETSCF